MRGGKNTYRLVLAGDSGDEGGLEEVLQRRMQARERLRGAAGLPGQRLGMSPCACGPGALTVLVIMEENTNQVDGQGQEPGGARGSN